MKKESEYKQSTSDAIIDIQFNDIFKLEEIQRLQDLFSDTNGVASLITLPDGTPITQPSNFTSLCKNIIRKTKKGCANCVKSDTILGHYNSSGPNVQPCLSGGLWDAGASITVGGKHIATWLVGQVRNDAMDNQHMMQYADEIGANKDDFMKALDDVPIMSIEQFKKISEMLFAFANQLSDKAYNILQLKIQIAEREKANELIREREENYADVFQTVTEGIAHTTLKGTVLSINKSLEQILEVPKNEIIGKNIINLAKDLLSGTNLKQVLPILTNLIQGKKIEPFQFKYKNKIIEITIASNHKTKRLTGVVRDITASKRAEDHLKESEEKYRILFANNPQPMWIYDLETLAILEVNLAATIHYGYSRDEFLSMTIKDIRPVEDLPALMLNLKTSDNGYNRSGEWRHIKKNGEIIFVEISSHKLIFNGRQARHVLVQDLTKRKLAELELLKQKNLLSTIIDSTTEAIFAKDLRGRYQSINEAGAKMFGSEIKDIIGHTDIELISKDTALEFRKTDEYVISSGKVFEREETGILAGQTRVYITHKTPWRDNEGNIIGVIGVSNEITDRKKAENLLIEKNEQIKKHIEEYKQINEELTQTNEELRKAKDQAFESDRLKTAFLQNMSHEIRTPMNAIMGFSGLLVDNYNKKSNLEKFSAIITQRSSDLLDIINDILDIAKIESGQLPINIEDCNLYELFTELNAFFAEYQKRMGKQHVKFSLQVLCNPLENVIVTDRVKLKQIFINLITNAFKFTDNGEIDGGCKFDENHKLMFFVSDTGIGISPDNQKIIFERFAQVHQGKNHSAGGTGLGLPIVKGLVGLLGGEISLKSEPGIGSVFSFSINYKTAQPSPQEPFTIENSTDYRFPNKTVLIVEDDEYNAQYIKEILSGTEMIILHTIYANEAIQISINQPIDIVLMDIRLPDIDGYEATRQIKQQKPDLKIIAQTAYASQDERQKAIKAGCNDYVSKPTKRDLLLSMIQKHLLSNNY